MAIIKILPSELLAQSAQMTTLKGEYESLFNQAMQCVKEVSGGMSTKISHNLDGKLSPTRKCFTNIENMLGNGAAIAKMSATTFSNPGKVMDLSASNPGASCAVAMNSGVSIVQFTDEEKKQIYDLMPEQMQKAYQGAKDADAFLQDYYNKLPPEARKMLDSYIPSDVKDGIDVFHDVTSGNISSETFGKVAAIVAPEEYKGLFKGLTTGYVEAFESHSETMDKLNAQYDECIDKCRDCINNGNVGGAFLEATKAIGTDVEKGFYYASDGFNNAIGNSLYEVKDKVDDVSKLITGIIPEQFDKTRGVVESTSETASDFLGNAGNYFKSLLGM